MAKAETESNTWTWPRDIEEPLLHEICGSPSFYGPWLAQEIIAGRVRWRPKPPFPPDEPFDDFWQGEGSPPEVDVKNCTATKLVVARIPEVVGLVSVTAVFQVVREDIERQIAPPASESHAQAIGTNERDGRVIRQIKAALPKLSRKVDNSDVLLYPDGKVPDEIPTETVKNELIAAGVKCSWDSVARALGRAK
jgi:hypothetical protein